MLGLALTEPQPEMWGGESRTVRQSESGVVRVIHPGKHGEHDLRVETFGIPTTFGDDIRALGAKFWAEDRYLERGGQGRWMFWELLDELVHSDCSPAEVERIAQKAEGKVRQKGKCAS